MRKILLIFCFMLLISMVYVSAAPNLETPSSIDLGEVSRNQTVSGIFTIKNTGNVTLTNVTPISGIADFNATGFNLTVNEESTIRFNLSVPSDSPTGNVTIGSIYFQSNEFESSSFPIKATVTGGLRIDDFDVILVMMNKRSRTHTDVTDGIKLDFGENYDIDPTSTLQFEFRIENEFMEEEDIEIQDISVLVTIKDIDDGEDIDEESNSFDLKPEDKENTVVILEIPLKVEEKDYDIEILVKGEDENGVEHKVEWDIEMRLEKETHDMYIASAYITKNKLSCSRVSSVKIRVINLGSRDEDEVKIEVKNAGIDLDFVKTGINLVEDPYDANNEYEKTVPMVVSSTVKAGTYPIDVNAYIKNTILLETRKVDLVIEDCHPNGEEIEEEPPEEVEEEEINETIPLEEAGSAEEAEEESITIPILNQETTVTKEKEPASMSKVLIIGSLAATIIIIVLLVSFVLLYSGKKG